jgi:hypothetical protein
MPDIVPDDDPFLRELRDSGIRPPQAPRRLRTGAPQRSPRCTRVVPLPAVYPTAAWNVPSPLPSITHARLFLE